MLFKKDTRKNLRELKGWKEKIWKKHKQKQAILITNQDKTGVAILIIHKKSKPFRQTITSNKEVHYTIEGFIKYT